MTVRRESIIIASVAIAATAYVAVGSWSVSLWYDEAATLAAVHRDLPDLWAMTHHVDAVHGLYYALMHVWTTAVGSSPWAVRLPSALAVGVALVGTYTLTRRVSDVPTAALASLFLLLLPRVTWAGIEARSSALTIAAAVWATVLLVRALDAPKLRRRWVGYALLLVLAVWLNIYLVLLLPAHALTLLMLHRPSRLWRGWLAAAAAVVLASTPIVLAAHSQSAQLGGVRLPLAGMLRSVVVNQWFLGATPAEGSDGGGSASGITAVDIASTDWLLSALVMTLIGWGLVGAALLPQKGKIPPWRQPAVAVSLPWLIFPSLMVIAYSITVTPVYHQRYLTWCAPALAMLMATGLQRLPNRTSRVIVTVALIAGSLVVFASQRQETAKGGYAWSSVATFVEAHRNSGDGVYYGPRTPPTGGTVRSSARLLEDAYPASFAGLDDVTLATSAVEGATLVGTSHPLAEVKDRLAAVDTLWVIRWADYPPDSAEQEDQILRDAGLEPDGSWTMSTTVVSRFVHR